MSETKNALGKKGPLPETQVKFFIVIQLKEISVSVKSASLISSYVLVDWTARQKKMNLILSYTELTQQTPSVLWSGIRANGNVPESNRALGDLCLLFRLYST